MKNLSFAEDPLTKTSDLSISQNLVKEMGLVNDAASTITVLTTHQHTSNSNPSLTFRDSFIEQSAICYASRRL